MIEVGEIYQAKFNHSINLESMPDTFISGSKNYSPKDSFIVSRKPDGEVLSRYGDYIWDLSPYQHNAASSKIYFSTVLDYYTEESIREIDTAKRIIFCLLYFSPRALGVSSIMGYWVVLRRLIKIAQIQQIPLQDIGQNTELLKHVILDLPEGRGQAIRLKFLFSILKAIGSDKTGISCLTEDQFLVLDNAIQIRRENRQHAVIPQSIYLSILNGLELALDDFNNVSDSVRSLLTMAYEDPPYGRARQTQRKLRVIHRGPYRPTFLEAAVDHGIDDWCTKMGITSIHEMGQHIRRLQSAALTSIYAYTGMRKSEGYYLTWDCLIKKSLGNNIVYLVQGGTRKLHKEDVTETWITSKEGEKAVASARLLSDVIAHGSGINLSKDHRSPLFLSTSILPFMNKRQTGNSHFSLPVASHIIADSLNKLFKIYDIDVSIKDSDYDELCATDPTRDWSSELDFSIGQNWPIKNHQFRRSLAVYAANSGFVTLPSLKRQLKHLSDQMSLYYSNNCSLSKSFGRRSGHISTEYRDEQLIRIARELMNRVFSEEVRLYGVGGKALERMKFSKTKPLYFTDEKETLKKVRNGELAYRETLLGGCISVDECSQGSFMAITSCIDCVNGIFFDSLTLEKISTAMDYVRLELSESTEGSYEFHAAQVQLDDLARLRNQIEDNQVAQDCLTHN